MRVGKRGGIWHLRHDILMTVRLQKGDFYVLEKEKINYYAEANINS
jgi:hypothetical protein